MLFSGTDCMKKKYQIKQTGEANPIRKVGMQLLPEFKKIKV